MYLCIYNEKTKQTRGDVEELDIVRFPYTRRSYELQCVLEPEWKLYCDTKPFAWPLDNQAQ
jgi:hypothetical protein